MRNAPQYVFWCKKKKKHYKNQHYISTLNNRDAAVPFGNGNADPALQFADFGVIVPQNCIVYQIDNSYCAEKHDADCTN